MYGIDPLYLILTVVTMAASRGVSYMLQKRFKEYSAMPIQLSGREVALRMLQDSGVGDVQVLATPGQLTDHYHPLKKTVNLSQVVDQQRNVAAAAVAAHECGHAIQHARAYGLLKMRSALVPIVNLSAKYMQWVLIAGIMIAMAGIPWLLLVGIVMFGLTTLFSFVTLPVEFNATAHANEWLARSGIVSAQQMPAAKNALWWAAMTYVVAALGSLGQLFYYIRMYMRASSR